MTEKNIDITHVGIYGVFCLKLILVVKLNVRTAQKEEDSETADIETVLVITNIKRAIS